MTKDQMRALLATLVPEAEARGDVYRVKRVGSGTTHDAAFAVRSKPNATPQVQTKAPRPLRTFPRQGVKGAGFAVPTTKRFHPDNDPLRYIGTDNTNSTRFTHPIYFCARCDCHGPDCTC